MLSLISGGSYEQPCTAVLAGSGGGTSSASGGGALYVSVEKLLELDGKINSDGFNGDSGGGGASGGTLRITGRHFEGNSNDLHCKLAFVSSPFILVVLQKRYIFVIKVTITK